MKSARCKDLTEFNIRKIQEVIEETINMKTFRSKSLKEKFLIHKMKNNEKNIKDIKKILIIGVSGTSFPKVPKGGIDRVPDLRKVIV